LKKEKEGNWKLEKFEESLKKKKEGRKEGREKTFFLGECSEDWVPRREF
jgi:ABC-type Fe3+-citrate transport system substrate-binding protein